MTGIALICQPRQRQIQEPASNECFPELESMLNEEPDFRKALRMIKRPSPRERYRSVMDWLLCSTLPHYKRPCFRFYEEDGAPNLKEMTTKSERRFIERMLQSAIKHAYLAFLREEQITWRVLRDEVEYAVEAEDAVPKED